MLHLLLACYIYYYLLFTVRCYASVVYALALCLSVCVCWSITSWILLKRLSGLSWFLAWWLPSSYPTLCCKEILVNPTIRVLPSRTVQDAGLRKFRHGGQSRVRCQWINKDDGQLLVAPLLYMLYRACRHSKQSPARFVAVGCQF